MKPRGCGQRSAAPRPRPRPRPCEGAPRMSPDVVTITPPPPAPPAASVAPAAVRGQIKCAVGHITCAGCRPYPAPSLLRPLLSLRPCLRTALSSPHAAPTALPVQTDPRTLCATDAGSAHLTCDRPRILCAIDRRSRLFSAHFICPLTDVASTSLPRCPRPKTRSARIGALNVTFLQDRRS